MAQRKSDDTSQKLNHKHYEVREGRSRYVVIDQGSGSWQAVTVCGSSQTGSLSNQFTLPPGITFVATVKLFWKLITRQYKVK